MTINDMSLIIILIIDDIVSFLTQSKSCSPIDNVLILRLFNLVTSWPGSSRLVPDSMISTELI